MLPKMINFEKGLLNYRLKSNNGKAKFNLRKKTRLRLKNISMSSKKT
jgi:hypothetical protein